MLHHSGGAYHHAVVVVEVYLHRVDSGIGGDVVGVVADGGNLGAADGIVVGGIVETLLRRFHTDYVGLNLRGELADYPRHVVGIAIVDHEGLCLSRESHRHGGNHDYISFHIVLIIKILLVSAARRCIGRR